MSAIEGRRADVVLTTARCASGALRSSAPWAVSEISVWVSVPEFAEAQRAQGGEVSKPDITVVRQKHN